MNRLAPWCFHHRRRVVARRLTSMVVDSAGALAEEVDRLGVDLAAAHTALETAEARERARIADDLHDILGHALEVVAFKAELADRLLGVDDGRAHREMVEIQRLARSAMNDVRSLARCRRPTDLDAELAGAVALFDSAGVEVTVIGGARSIPGCARDLLARVLREAVTNVLRHATPTQCFITLEQDSLGASIAVVNNGVGTRAATLSPGGTGLAGLARLLAEHRGRLSAGHNGSGYFTLRATVTATPGEPVLANIPRASRHGAPRLSVPR